MEFKGSSSRWTSGPSCTSSGLTGCDRGGLGCDVESCGEESTTGVEYSSLERWLVTLSLVRSLRFLKALLRLSRKDLLETAGL